MCGDVRWQVVTHNVHSDGSLTFCSLAQQSRANSSSVPHKLLRSIALRAQRNMSSAPM